MFCDAEVMLCKVPLFFRFPLFALGVFLALYSECGLLLANAALRPRPAPRFVGLKISPAGKRGEGGKEGDGSRHTLKRSPSQPLAAHTFGVVRRGAVSNE